jgi:hypothetical protein
MSRTSVGRDALIAVYTLMARLLYRRKILDAAKMSARAIAAGE